MAQATGSIQFDNALPDQYTRLTINDGQGTGYSEVTLHFGGNGGSNFQHNPFKTSNNHQNQYSGQGALKVIPLYLTGTGNTRPYMRLRFDRNSQNAAFWQSISTGGTHPARLVFRDYAGNEVKITFVNEDLTNWSDGDALASPNAETRGRRQSAGEYHLSTWTNQFYPLLSSNFTETILKILRAARELGEINLGSDDHLKIQSSYLKIASDTAGGPDNGPISVMIERASGTWTQLDKDLFWATLTDDGGFQELQGDIFAHVDEPNAPVYSFYSFTNDTDLTPGGSGAGAAMASYVATIINNLGIQITAAASSDTVSLTNDNEGTDGNISMTAIKYASSNVSSAAGGLTIAGLAGGSAGGGGGGGGNLVVSESITAASGGTVTATGAAVTIPASSLSSDTTIGIDLSSNESDPVLSGIGAAIGDPGAQSYSPVVELTPHGTQFSSAVTVTFDLDGSVAGSCPANLKIYKRNSATGAWYELPSNLWSCSSGTITISTTSFSQYQAIGGTNMARTKLNNVQIAKLIEANKVLGGAIDITGSADTKASLVAADKFLIQASSGVSQQIAASTMQEFFSKVDLTNASGSSRHSLVMAVSGSTDDAILYVDSGIEFKPDTDEFFLHGDITVEGGKITLSNGATMDSETAGELKLTEDQISIIGALSGSGAASFAGALSIDGAADLDSTLNVEGVATFQADMTASAGLHINGGAVANSMIVEDLTDNRIVIAGTGGELEDSANLTFDGSALAVGGQISGSGNLSSGGQLTVAGASDLNGSLNVEGAAVFQTHVTASGDLVVAGTGSVSGDFTISGNLTVAGSTTTVNTEEVTIADHNIVLDSNNSLSDVVSGAGITLEGGSGDDITFQYDGSNSMDLKKGSSFYQLHIGDLQAAAATFSSDVTASAGMRIAGDAAVVGGLDVDGATTLDGLTVAEVATFSADITASAGMHIAQELHVDGVLQADGAADLNSTLNVQGVSTFQADITASAGLHVNAGAEINSLKVEDLTSGRIVLAGTGGEIEDSANLAFNGSQLSVTGIISGSGNLQAGGALEVAGVASFASDITASAGMHLAQELHVDGAAQLDGALAVAGRTDLNGIVSLGDSSADAVYVSGTFEVGATSTVLGSNQIQFTNLDDLDESTVASGDMFMIKDVSASGYAKEITLADVGHYFAQSGSTQGIQVDNTTGKFSIDYVEDIATSASKASILSNDLVTASLSQEPLADSLQVYLNGMLQVASGSAGAIFDYKYAGSAGSRRVEFVVALDSDDVVQLRYVKK